MKYVIRSYYRDLEFNNSHRKVFCSEKSGQIYLNRALDKFGITLTPGYIFRVEKLNEVQHC